MKRFLWIICILILYMTSCTEIIYIYEDTPSNEEVTDDNIQKPSDETGNDKEEDNDKVEEDPYAKDLGASANCYIVSESGYYRFLSVKGNTSESVGSVASVDVLWESYGTDECPSVGDLIKSVTYKPDGIYFQTATPFKEGNAVIAARDSNGKILWSWHIWLTDQPIECIYANNAGVMMDRNLGATSAEEGDVCALGLLYQWGRKDPFLGSSSISKSIEANSTITWPLPIESTKTVGTIEYSILNPTTFITKYQKDWLYSTSYSIDKTRWKSAKTKYDPCPAGWRVPDNSENGVWVKSGLTDSDFYYGGDTVDRGITLSNKYSVPESWYPATGAKMGDSGSLSGVGNWSDSWSVTPGIYNDMFVFSFNIVVNYLYIQRSGYGTLACGNPVRCQKD